MKAQKGTWEDAMNRRKRAAATALTYLTLAMEESRRERTQLQRMHARHLVNSEDMQRSLHTALRHKFSVELRYAAGRYGEDEVEQALCTLKEPFGFAKVPAGDVQFVLVFGARRGRKG